MLRAIRARMGQTVAHWICAAVLLLLGACAPAVPDRADPEDVTRLAQSLAALGPQVAAEEAARAARIALTYPLQLRAQYGVTDPPLVHNTKVNAGLRPRGLCWHWADDLEARLRRENLQGFTLHRAIANADNPVLIDHSTVILSARGAPMEEGIVLDPWRYGGRLFWARVPEDRRYTWVARADVFAMRKGAGPAKTGRAARLSPPEPE